MARLTPDARQRQIDTLKIFNDNVNEVTPNEEYSIGFMSSNRQFHLNVYLSSSFPNEKPKLHIAPSINHQWVDGTTGEIQNAPGLLNFTIHSDLGRVVHAIIREFERFPPLLWSNEMVTSPMQAITLPTVVDMPELSGLSIEELRLLDENEEHLNDFVEDMSAVQSLTDELDGLIGEVEAITDGNMCKMDKYNELRQSIADGYAKLRNVGDKWDVASKKYLEKTEEFSPLHIKELLQIAVSSADTKCEQHVENFLNGRIDVQTFLDDYTKSKRLSALRKAKEERLTHQLNALERAAQ
ncbi:vacuolar protein sorting-associated protein 37A [Bradysia coprophila]|uniref:vacuolar protein sorting-associated protein 37A n=1 Tax=Bradysia coprophila TaxID=38358 RepID=UPI00187D9E86|nr:vacuolar protein sorting-associated protein 37A [Bradysia coprophila]